MRHLRPGHVASPHVRHAKGHPGEVVIKRSRGKFPRPSAMVKQSVSMIASPRRSWWKTYVKHASLNMQMDQHVACHCNPTHPRAFYPTESCLMKTHVDCNLSCAVCNVGALR